MAYVIRALGFLLIPVIVSGVITVLRQPKKAKKGKVYLPALLAIIGIIGCTGFLIPTLITAFTEETPWISLGFLAFSLLGASLIVAVVNCRVSYDQDGFVAKNFWGIKRKYTYDQVTAIKEGMHEDYLYVGKRRIMIDEFAIGGAEFIGFVSKKYRATHGGRNLPVVRKTKGDIFNGNVEDVFGFMFAYISVGVLCVVFLIFIIWSVYFQQYTAENTIMQQVTFNSYTVQKQNIVLDAGADLPYKVNTGGRDFDADKIKALCDGKTAYTVYVKEITPDDSQDYYMIKAIMQGEEYELSFEQTNAQHVQENRVLIIFPVAFAVLWGIYVFLSIRVGRNPQKYSKRVIRLFFRDGYVKYR